MNRTNADDALTARIAIAGGSLTRDGAAWTIDGTSTTVTNAEVRRLYGLGVLTGRRSDGKATLVQSRWMTRQKDKAAPAINSCITYRTSEYRSFTDPKRSRYVWGRVLSVTDRGVLVLGQPNHARVPMLAIVNRRTPADHWKATERLALGHWAPGSIHHDPALWARLEAAWLLPAIWTMPPQGEPHTLARLDWVAARLRSIGASAVTAEEAAAVQLYPSDSIGALATWEVHRLRWIRQCALRSRHGEDCYRNVPLADYLDAVIVREAEAVKAAEVKAIRELIGRMYENELARCRSRLGSPERDRITIPTLEALRYRIAEDREQWSDDSVVEAHAAATAIMAGHIAKEEARRAARSTRP